MSYSMLPPNPDPDLSDIAEELAKALHRCRSFLPVFAEPSRKTERAQSADDQASAALDAYCEYAGIRIQALNP